MSGIVIIGAGQAGASAAQTLRENDYTGSITLIAGEPHYPYERPPLSKDVLQGSAEAASAYLQPESWYEENNIDVRTDTAAVSLDAEKHTVLLGSGETLPYEQALLATGSRARTLDLAGSDLEGVHTLRTIDESRALYDALSEGDQKLVVIGTGWIGMEVAASARTLGNEVTVLGRGNVPLAGVLGEKIGQGYQSLHESHGVVFRMNTEAEAIVGRDRVEGVQIDGEVIPADQVIVAVGAIPNLEVAERSGIEIDNGVLTTARLATSASDVFAAGDIVNELHPVLNGRLRVEHWGTALAQGESAALAMLGRQVSYDKIPYFFTDQFDLGMELAGYPPLMEDAEVVIRGDFAGNEYIAFWVREGRVVGGMNVNIWDVNDTIQDLIASGQHVETAKLADSSVALEDLRAQ
ncbi:MAG: NAD(P)/FAD-dependent oxidoreductase [Canibacter sp.]